MSLMLRSYSELRKLDSFKARYDYLRLKGNVGQSTFGFDRYLNQILYKSREWQRARDKVIIRDEGRDLGIEGYEIVSQKIIVHHINPITIEDVESGNIAVYDPEFLICTTNATHLAIHFGDESQLAKSLVIRRPGDTTLWR